MTEWIGGLVAFLLTVIVLSYAFTGPSGLFRIVVHLFVGATAGYVGAVAIYGVLWPQLGRPLLTERQTLLLVPLLLGLLLFLRLTQRWRRWATPSLALLVGVGAAAAIGGSVLGTLLPQTAATMNALDWQAEPDPLLRLERLFDGLIVFVGTIATLAYFHFGLRRSGQRGDYQPAWLRVLRGLGQAFIAVAFGVLFAGVLAAALTALADRLQFLWQFLVSLWQLR